MRFCFVSGVKLGAVPQASPKDLSWIPNWDSIQAGGGGLSLKPVITQHLKVCATVYCCVLDKHPTPFKWQKHKERTELCEILGI